MADEQNREAQNTERARQLLAEERKVSDRAREEYAERMKGRPTPTQDENDRAACGEHIAKHDDDGSGPELSWGPHQRKTLEADRPAGGAYQTRQASPASPASPAHSRQPPPRHTGGE
jgi:hypothetical protein